MTSLSEFCCPFIFQLIAGVIPNNNCQVVYNSTRAIFGLYVVSLLSAKCKLTRSCLRILSRLWKASFTDMTKQKQQKVKEVTKMYENGQMS